MVILTIGAVAWREARGASRPALSPEEARAAMSKGNYKDAYDSLAPRVLSAEGTNQLSSDYLVCLSALMSLGRMEEMDEFREKAVEAHGADWKFLQTAAQSYRDYQHYGSIVSGKFLRGNNRNRDGKWVSSLDRDRVRALQLYRQAVASLPADGGNRAEAATLYYDFAQTLMLGNQGSSAWRLQTLTDLSKLPDYEETDSPYAWRGYGEARGAPVDAAGQPVYHQ
jgi:hypothetical protein